MKRKSEIPLYKVTLLLFDGDWEKLKEIYPRIGPSRAIRQIVRKHLLSVEEAVKMEAPNGNTN